MAKRRNTGTYLFVKDGQARTARPQVATAVSIAPDVFPEPTERLRVRRRAVALEPAAVDARLAVWLEPHSAASLRIYDAANALLTQLLEAGSVLLCPAGPGADARTTTIQLAAAAAASVRTTVIDAADDPTSLTALLGLGEPPGLGELLDARHADATSPIDLLGIGRGLDVLPRGDRTRHPRDHGGCLAQVVADLRRYAGLVLVAGPHPDHADYAIFSAAVDAVVVLGRRDQLEGRGDAWPPTDGRPLGRIVTRAPA